MRYIAKHYVTISRRMFTPGEVIHIPIPDDKLPRLLKLGAIIPDPSASYAANISKKMDAEKAHEDVQQNNAAQLHGLDCPPDDNPLPASEEIADGEAQDVADDEADVPEIDVMDGIVSASDETAERAPIKKNTKGRKRT